ncbi:MAG: HipA family kinase [Dehalococcoidia bacterium]
MLRTVTATRYVTPLREGGSLPGLVEADDDGLYVLKFRGAGQGPKALIADLVAGEIARVLGLPTPELVRIELDPALGDAEPDFEIRRLLEQSGGLNLGVDFLPGSLPFSPAVRPPPDPDFAADVVWFDALVMNVDRTVRNPNLLTWHRRVWLIDHGAALYIHHTWHDPLQHALGLFTPIRDQVLLPFAGSIEAADKRLAPLLDEARLTAILAEVPDGWLADDQRTPDERRNDYLDYLVKRLEHPRRFVEEAERARSAA